jgi:hypothetical protein
MPSKFEHYLIHITKYNTDAYVANLYSTNGVIVTHPWGVLGGNMHSNVVNAIAYYFQRLGITTIRFNIAIIQNKSLLHNNNNNDNNNHNRNHNHNNRNILTIRTKGWIHHRLSPNSRYRHQNHYWYQRL